MSTVFDELILTGSEIPMPGPWARRGRCRTAPTEIFFPGRGDSTDEANAICARCAVVDDCRAYAVSHPSLQGIWAGTSFKERQQLRMASPPVTEATIEAELELVRPAKYSPSGAMYLALEELVAYPGRWARVARYAGKNSAQSMASQLRTGGRRIPAGLWQFEGRRNDAGGSDLYALFEREPHEATA